MGKILKVSTAATWLLYLRNGFPLGDYLRRKLELALLAPLALIFYPLSVGLLRVGVHIWPIFSERLGHQCLESDCAIRWSRAARGSRIIVLVSRRKRLANQRFFDYMPTGIKHIAGRGAYACAIILTYFSLYRTAKAFCRVPTARQTHHEIINRTPGVFRMDEVQREASQQLLMKLIMASKLPVGARSPKHYCVFNYRHPYHDVAGDKLQAQRYSSAINLKGALSYLRKAGIIPVLTGSPPKEEIDCLPADQYINYAGSEWKSDENDILLSGNASFCLGSTSGLTLLSSVFGVPCIIHNQVPYKEFWYSPEDILIPKLIRNKCTGEFAPFRKDIVESALQSHYLIGSADNVDHYEESSEEDILFAVIEMCLRLNLVSGTEITSCITSRGSVSAAFQRKYAIYLPTT